MSHARKVLRDFVRDLIVTIPGFADGNIETNRPTPASSDELPFCFIYSLSETSKQLNVSQSLYKRTLNLAIEARIKATESVDDQLDAMAELIETKINANHDLGGTANSVSLISTEVDISAEGETPIGAIRLVYEIVYIY